MVFVWAIGKHALVEHHFSLLDRHCTGRAMTNVVSSVANAGNHEYLGTSPPKYCLLQPVGNYSALRQLESQSTGLHGHKGLSKGYLSIILNAFLLKTARYLLRFV